jgi:hypothetical protein
MSLREIRLCDVETTKTGGSGGGAARVICQGLYVATCPLCDVDCCKEHFVDSGSSSGCYISVSFTIFTRSNQYALGSQRANVCKACGDKLVKLQQTLNAVAREIPLIEPLRGILTAQALTQDQENE